jgi:hypothetical protein
LGIHRFYIISTERNEEESLKEEMLRGRQEEEKERTKKGRQTKGIDGLTEEGRKTGRKGKGQSKD